MPLCSAREDLGYDLSTTINRTGNKQHIVSKTDTNKTRKQNSRLYNRPLYTYTDTIHAD